MGYAVTVVCTTYNHESYIEQCLESLATQKTTFPYKVVVHDDASTDGTSDIIRKMAAKYPDVIQPVIQVENQHSKGVSVSQNCAQYLEGPYAAFCEGDDFWISEDKLQKQYDYLENNPDCSLCVHGAKYFNQKLGRFKGTCECSQEEIDLSLSDIIKGSAAMFATNSMFFRSELYVMPDVYQNWGIADFPWALHMAENGRVHYLPELLSAYRVAVPGSWTATTAASKKRNIEFRRHLADSLEQLIPRYGEELRHDLEMAIAERRDVALSEEGKWSEIVKDPHYKEFPFMLKAQMFVRCKFPNLTDKLLGRVE